LRVTRCAITAVDRQLASYLFLYMRVQNSTARFCIRWLVVAVFLVCGQGFAQPQSPALKAKVDERVELLSIVFRLAGSPEYSMSPLDGYTRDIDSYFGPFKKHPAVILAKKLSQHGVGYDAVMTMAVHLSPPPSLQPLVPFSNQVPGKRWGEFNAKEFARLLRDFYTDTHFEKFTTSHRAMYDMAEKRFADTLRSVDLGWFARFYGESSINQFHVLLGMNNGGGNYGVKVRFPDARQEAFAIIGCWTKDEAGNPDYPSSADYLPTVIHEFNHSFVNPLVERNWAKFKSAEKVFAPVEVSMRSQAYGNAQDMIDESLVRAAVIIYSKTRSDSHSLELSIRKEEANGFVWMKELCLLLEQYQAERKRYPRFQSFVPMVASFYDALAPRIKTELAEFKAKCVHVSGLQPFPNHDGAIAAGVRTMIISFDKPLNPLAGYSIQYGPKGKSEFPISAAPEFLPGNNELKLQLQLEPNSHYSFEISGSLSLDGYPVETYQVEFHTK
jgi:uncharacterized protein DUF4932